MSTWRAPSSTATPRAWSMPCSTRWRAPSARPSLPRRPGNRPMPKRARPGELALIARYFRPLAKDKGAFGLVDDAALLKPRRGREIVATADLVAEGVHFFADDPPDAIAKKALRVNLSDLAAKGARPLGY